MLPDFTDQKELARLRVLAAHRLAQIKAANREIGRQQMRLSGRAATIRRQAKELARLRDMIDRLYPLPDWCPLPDVAEAANEITEGKSDD